MAGEGQLCVRSYGLLILALNGDLIILSPLILSLFWRLAFGGVQVVSLPPPKLCASWAATSPSGWPVKGVGIDSGVDPCW